MYELFIFELFPSGMNTQFSSGKSVLESELQAPPVMMSLKVMDMLCYCVNYELINGVTSSHFGSLKSMISTKVRL